MRRFTLLLVLLVLLPLLAHHQHTPLEQQRLQSPDGRYTAVVSATRLWLWLAALPGWQDGVRGQIQILDQQQRSLGSMPLPRLAMAQDLRWIAHGARIRHVGAWNFRDGFHAYWNDDQTFVHTQQAD